MFDSFDHLCMSRALRQAERGIDSTHPNPRVGCVLARDGKVIATGWHRAAGGPHAEIDALDKAGEEARGATAYVTLEPCNHRARTGACTDALIRAGVARVVCATLDNNPRVNGGGVAQLEEAGIRVDTGLLREQAERLNPGFFMRMRENRPWIRVKLAQSLDGGIALANGNSQWISSEASRRDVQNWRARSSAILTGIGTILADNPSLDVRRKGAIRQPVRVIADSRWRTPPDAVTLSVPGQVVIAGLAGAAIPEQLKKSGAALLPLEEDSGRLDLRALMRALAEREINEVQVEAGATLAGSLLERKLVDELLVYQAPVLLGSGTLPPFALGPLADMQQRIPLRWIESAHTGVDLRLRFETDFNQALATGRCLPE